MISIINFLIIFFLLSPSCSFLIYNNRLDEKKYMPYSIKVSIKNADFEYYKARQEQYDRLANFSLKDEVIEHYYGVIDGYPVVDIYNKVIFDEYVLGDYTISQNIYSYVFKYIHSHKIYIKYANQWYTLYSAYCVGFLDEDLTYDIYLENCRFNNIDPIDKKI